MPGISENASALTTQASTEAEQSQAARLASLCVPDKEPVQVAEGEEEDTFWEALGGKEDYSAGVDINRPVLNPRLFHVVLKESGAVRANEIYNFEQKVTGVKYMQCQLTLRLCACQRKTMINNFMKVLKAQHRRSFFFRTWWRTTSCWWTAAQRSTFGLEAPPPSRRETRPWAWPKPISTRIRPTGGVDCWDLI